MTIETQNHSTTTVKVAVNHLDNRYMACLSMKEGEDIYRFTSDLHKCARHLKRNMYHVKNAQIVDLHTGEVPVTIRGEGCLELWVSSEILPVWRGV